MFWINWLIKIDDQVHNLCRTEYFHCSHTSLTNNKYWKYPLTFSLTNIILFISPLIFISVYEIFKLDNLTNLQTYFELSKPNWFVASGGKKLFVEF